MSEGVCPVPAMTGVIRAQVALLLAVGLLGFAYGASAQQAAEEPPVFEAHKLYWARKPTPHEFARAYPEKAQRQNIQGRGVVVCTIGLELTLEACEIIQETLPGWGFGDAAMSLTSLFKLKQKQADPRVVAGAKVFLPIVFTLPGG